MELIPGDNFSNIGSVTFRQFQTECSGFDLASALSFIQRESAAMGSQALKEINVHNRVLGSGHAYISPETHAFIAKHLLLNSSFLHYQPFRKSDYEKLVIYFNHLETDLNYVDPSHPNAQRWLIRASYAQGRYQRIPNQILGRYYILFKELGRSSQICSDMVKEATGFDITEIMLIGISFYAVILHTGYFDVRHVKEHSVPGLQDVLQSEKVDMFLKNISVSQDDFRGLCSRWSWDNVLLKKYEFNPLWLYPIIDTGILAPSSRYIVPSLNDLAYRFTEGIYYSTMDYYSQGGRKNDFSTEFGALFQDYVGYHLENVRERNRNLGTVQREAEYNCNKNRWRSADWLLISTDAVVQVECKKITTSIKFRAAISDDSGRDFDALLDEFAQHVAKLYQKSIHIHQERLDFLSNVVTTVFSVFVVMDDFYLIDSRLKRKITARAAQIVPSISQGFRYHILSCGAFEILCEFLRTHPAIKLTELLELKEREQNYYTDFARFLEEEFGCECYEIGLVWEAADKLCSLSARS
jgi:hypothetical protein